MVIDLGEVRDAPVADPPRRPWSPRQRRAVAAVGAVVALFGGVAAAEPVRGTLAHVSIQADPEDEWIVDGDRLYVISPAAPDRRTLAVYRLPGASLLWRVALPLTGDVRGFSAIEGTLLGVSEPQAIETTALDAATGRVRWRHPGSWQIGGPGHVLLHAQEPGGPTFQVRSVALDTGVARWSLELPSGDWLQVESDFMVRWAASGLVEVRDLQTAAVRRSIQLTGDSGNNPASGYVAGDLLLYAERGGDRPMVTAYGLEKLDRRWQAEIDLANEYVAPDCGGGLCVGGYPNGVRLLDAATGGIRWVSSEWSLAEQLGPYLVGIRPEDPPARRAVLDPATGRELRDLGRWETGIPDEGGRSLGVRTDPRTGATVVAWLDPGEAGPRILGALRWVFSCQAVEWTVICRDPGGAIRVWYPRRRL